MFFWFFMISICNCLLESASHPSMLRMDAASGAKHSPPGLEVGRPKGGIRWSHRDCCRTFTFRRFSDSRRIAG